MQQRGKNVVAAIAISAALLIFLGMGYLWCCGAIVDTHTGSTRAYVRIHSEYIEAYRKQTGKYPASLEQLVREGVIRDTLRDSWGNPMQYRFPSQRVGVPFELWSLGAD